MMKRLSLILLGGLFLLPTIVQSQPERIFEKFQDRFGPRLHPHDLRIHQLEVAPDPFREGDPITFQVLVFNLANYSGRVSLFIKDRDEVITSVYDVLLRPGQNRIIFPQTHYRFRRFEHCFTVEVDIEKTRALVDLVKDFCAQRTYYGWTLKGPRVGPLFVEDLDMFPDPATPGQEIRFRVRLRNDGRPLRAHIRIQDKDQLVAQLEDVFLPRGYSEHYFHYMRYPFQRFDHCFMVILDIDRTPYRVDAAREFCAKPLGWTLKP